MGDGLKKFGNFCARKCGGLATSIGGATAMAGGILFVALAGGFALSALTGGALLPVLAAFASTLPLTLSMMAGGGAVAFGGMKLAEAGGEKHAFAAPEAASGFQAKKLGPAFTAAQDNSSTAAIDLAPLAVMMLSR